MSDVKSIAMVFVMIFASACGSPDPKSDDSATNGGSNSSRNGASNGATNSASTNNATAGSNNGSTDGPTNGPTNGTTGPNASTNNGSTGESCEILTSESDESYCNLQATCGEQTVLAECLFDEVWRCFCGIDSHLYPENPCANPDFWASRLADDCEAGE